MGRYLNPGQIRLQGLLWCTYTEYNGLRNLLCTWLPQGLYLIMCCKLTTKVTEILSNISVTKTRDNRTKRVWYRGEGKGE